MNRLVSSLFVVLLVGSGCTGDEAVHSVNDADERVSGGVSIEADVVLPVDGYVERRTWKAFGEYFALRFRGYHTGDDIEFSDVAAEVPVYAIEDGTVLYLDWVAGYGGVMVIEHTLADGSTVRALYGHIDQESAVVRVGDTVTQGQTIAYLGKGESKETDKERKHLHFALYSGEEFMVNGYTLNEDGLLAWMNPQDFFMAHHVDMTSSAFTFSGEKEETTSDVYTLTFDVPEGWAAEYVPQIDAFNLYTLDGEGSARARSQMMIRLFRANDFLTLNTVTIHSVADVTVGEDDYVGKRYDIEKKPDAVDFSYQPDWVNGRVIATDFRAKDGETTYYVFVKGPEVSEEIYAHVLDGVTIE